MGDRRVTYDEALAALAERGRFGIRLGLGRTRALLRELGDPHRSIRGALVAGHERQGQRAGARGQRPAGGRAAGRRDPEAAPRDLPRADRGRRPPDRRDHVHPARRDACCRSPTGSRGGSASPPNSSSSRPSSSWHSPSRTSIWPSSRWAWAAGWTRPTPGTAASRSSPTSTLDHMDRLGPTIRHIAREKAAIIERGDLAVTGRRRGRARDRPPPCPPHGRAAHRGRPPRPSWAGTATGSTSTLPAPRADPRRPARPAPGDERRRGRCPARRPRRGGHRRRRPGRPSHGLRDGHLAGPARAAPRRRPRRPPRRRPQPGRCRGARGGARRPAAVPGGRTADPRDGIDGRQGRRRRHRGALDGRGAARGLDRRAPQVGRRGAPCRPPTLAARWAAARPGAPPPSVAADPTAAMDLALAGGRGPVVVAGSLYLVGAVRAILVDDPDLRDPDARSVMTPADPTAPPRATRIGPTTFAWGARTYVMGIVNVTPDSFSGDGLLAETAADPVAAAVETARRMVAEGADLLDIGGESTRPGHAPVDAEAERARVVPVIAAVRAALPATPISVDTTKPAVADAAIDAGADLVNDVWGVGDGRRPAAPRGRPARPAGRHAQPARAGLPRPRRRGGRRPARARSSARSVSGSPRTTSSSTRASASGRRPRRTSRSSATSTRCARSAGRSCSGPRASRRSAGSSTCPSTSGSRRTLATTAIGIAAGRGHRPGP